MAYVDNVALRGGVSRLSYAEPRLTLEALPSSRPLAAYNVLAINFQTELMSPLHKADVSPFAGTRTAP